MSIIAANSLLWVGQGCLRSKLSADRLACVTGLSILLPHDCLLPLNHKQHREFWSILRVLISIGLFFLLSQCCRSTISSSHALLSPSPLSFIFPSIRVFSNESAVHIRWPKYWSFSISPSNEYSGLISFRIDWLDLLAVQGTLKSLSPALQFKSISAQPSL